MIGLLSSTKRSRPAEPVGCSTDLERLATSRQILSA